MHDMVILWTIAGVILGWIFGRILVEVADGIFERNMPVVLKFGMGYVGGLTAYTIASVLIN